MKLLLTKEDLGYLGRGKDSGGLEIKIEAPLFIESYQGKVCVNIWDGQNWQKIVLKQEGK